MVAGDSGEIKIKIHQLLSTETVHTSRHLQLQQVVDAGELLLDGVAVVVVVRAAHVGVNVRVSVDRRQRFTLHTLQIFSLEQRVKVDVLLDATKLVILIE